MTVSSTLSRWDFVGNGTLDTYQYACEIYLKSDLKVYVSGILKVVDTHYIVTGSPPLYGINNPDGGNIVFYPDYIPAVGAPIAIILDLPLTQLADYKEGDKFPAETHERALDRLIKIAQSFNNVLGRILKVPFWSTLSNILVEINAGKYLRWNAGGTSIICDSGTTIGAHGETHEKGNADEFDTVTPLTTQGDILYRDASGLQRLPAGTSGYLLKTQGMGANPIWGGPGLSSTEIINLIYPVGSIYVSVIATNPGTLFGVGTWTAFGTGRVLVGIDASQAEFDTVEETGGAKTVGIAHTHTGPSHTHDFDKGSISCADVPVVDYATESGDYMAGYVAGVVLRNAIKHITVAGGTGATGAMNENATPSTLQPYIICYFWKRTA